MLSCDELRTLLENALRVLKADPLEQMEQLEREFGDCSLVDELALELDRLVGVMMTNDWAKDCVLPDQREAILAVHAFLGSMSGESNAALWTPEALLRRPEWIETRSLAKRALSLMELPGTAFG